MEEFWVKLLELLEAGIVPPPEARNLPKQDGLLAMLGECSWHCVCMDVFVVVIACTRVQGLVPRN